MSVTANAAIDNVLLQGARGMRTVPRTEVGFVAAVTLGGISGMQQLGNRCWPQRDTD